MIYIIFLAHFIADFLAQSDDVAIRKGKELYILAYHCWLYATIVSFAYVGLPIPSMWFVAIVGYQFLTHGIVDFISSKFTTKFHLSGQRHWFFVTIGADQLVHAYSLLILLQYLES